MDYDTFVESLKIGFKSNILVLESCWVLMLGIIFLAGLGYGIYRTVTKKEESYRQIIGAPLYDRKLLTNTFYSKSNNQRRSWVRVPLNLNVQFIKDNFDIAASDAKYLSARLQNLSAGGMLMLSEHKLKENDKIKIQLQLPPAQIFKFNGRVVRVSKKTTNAVPHYQIGIQFFGIAERDRDKIIQFLFQHQREWIQQKINESNLQN
ncbi:PilZ domain-containing protein [Bacillota bacterium LX-D]|nr:PilZ domain-containing protein [Bacillota bacterium LX-D]